MAEWRDDACMAMWLQDCLFAKIRDKRDAENRVDVSKRRMGGEYASFGRFRKWLLFRRLTEDRLPGGWGMAAERRQTGLLSGRVSPAKWPIWPC